MFGRVNCRGVILGGSGRAMIVGGEDGERVGR